MTISKEQIMNNETGEYIIVDNRIFSMCVDAQLKLIRDLAMEKILSIAPEYKQRNAALGLLSDTETQQIKDSIQYVRNISNSLEQQILAIIWDGTEENRISACDAVQYICWP
jgi:hypothetical protein